MAVSVGMRNIMYVCVDGRLIVEDTSTQTVSIPTSIYVIFPSISGWQSVLWIWRLRRHTDTHNTHTCANEHDILFVCVFATYRLTISAWPNLRFTRLMPGSAIELHIHMVAINWIDTRRGGYHIRYSITIAIYQSDIMPTNAPISYSPTLSASQARGLAPHWIFPSTAH